MGGGTSRKVKQVYIGNGNTARKVVKGYIGVNGIAKQFWPSIYTWIKYQVKYTTLTSTTAYGTFRDPIHEISWSTTRDSATLYTYSNSLSQPSFDANNLDNWLFVDGFPTASTIRSETITYDDPNIYQTRGPSVMAGYIDPDYKYSVNDRDKTGYGNYDVSIGLISDNEARENLAAGKAEFVVAQLTWSSFAGEWASGGNIYRYRIAETPEMTEIETVESDNPNAYPENGRHSDGYWYVLQPE